MMTLQRSSPDVSKVDRVRQFRIVGLGVSLAAAQSERKRQPDVPYVPTTEEAVRAMLKLADVLTSSTILVVEASAS